jgi:hypothetical protein
MQIVYNKSKNIDKTKDYTCHTCKNQFNWVAGESCWFGSMKMMDELSDKIKYFCSEKCSRIITKK